MRTNTNARLSTKKVYSRLRIKKKSSYTYLRLYSLCFSCAIKEIHHFVHLFLVAATAASSTAGGNDGEWKNDIYTIARFFFVCIFYFFIFSRAHLFKRIDSIIILKKIIIHRQQKKKTIIFTFI